jgi:acrylyl-CoA reductase (NADPH)
MAATFGASGNRGVTRQITCCGNVASPDLFLNVIPLILRGGSLVGIDSQRIVPKEHRKRVWQKLATKWKPTQLNNLCREVGLDELDREIECILKGGQKGRVIVGLGL